LSRDKQFPFFSHRTEVQTSKIERVLFQDKTVGFPDFKFVDQKGCKNITGDLQIAKTKRNSRKRTSRRRIVRFRTQLKFVNLEI
jgi:hypothetical protein